jgi:hypothetical protein
MLRHFVTGYHRKVLIIIIGMVAIILFTASDLEHTFRIIKIFTFSPLHL